MECMIAISEGNVNETLEKFLTISVEEVSKFFTYFLEK
jgi:hypothetical protein